MRIFLKSFGCSANQADGFSLAGCLSKAGYELVGSLEHADLVIYNTCAVKGPTENRMIDACRRVQREKKLIVAGCLPLINFERLQETVHFDAAIGPAAAEQIVQIVKRVSNGGKVLWLEGALERRPPLNLPRAQVKPVVSMIPVCYGCLGSCSYCCVTFARGRLRSYSVDEIVERVREDVKAGLCEFWLTAQDVGCYGRDIRSNLAELLEAVCSVKGDFKVRVGMMTPNSIFDTLDELIRAFEDEKIFKFLHLPVQSGNDEVLKQMRRFYSSDDFRTIIQRFRDAFPTVSLSTDVICGFPGEKKQAFRDTLNLIEEVKLDIVNVSKFFARPKTFAAQMKDIVLPSEIRMRSAAAAKLAKKIAFERNKLWMGWKGPILVDEVGKVPGSLVGRNFAYKPIAVRGPADLLGKTINVRVAKTFSTYLAAEIVE